MMSALKQASRTSICLAWLIGLLAGVGQSACAGNYLYQIRGNASGTTSTNIWRIDPNAPSETLVYANYPGGNSATLAQCPNGLLFYVINAANGAVYRWDPATPTTAPAQIGTLGTSVPASFRMACHPNGTLYYLPDSGALYTINQSTGAATATGATISGLTSGGDMAFNPAGVLYVLSSTRQLYTAPLAGGAATSVGAITGITSTNPTLGLAFNSAGGLYVQARDPTQLYSVNVGTLAATSVLALSGGTSATGDLASTTVTSPTVSKSFAPTTVVTNAASVLTITLSNSNSVATSGAALTDTYPTGLVNTAAAGTNTCGGTVSASAGSGSVTLAGGTIPANGSCTVTLSVTSSSVGSYVNSIPARGVTTATGYNDAAASATLTVVAPSFTVLKTLQVLSDPVNGATFPKAIPGAVVAYTIRVTNTGAGTADSNSTAIVDPIPANSSLFVGDLGAAGSGPLAFANGSPTSGLTYAYTSLASATDDVSFSNNGGATFSYTPVPDASGFDASVTHIRVNPKGTFAAASGGNNPNFTLTFRVKVK